MMYLLGTNICIYLINKQHDQLLMRLIQVGRDSLAISTVTVAEMALGIDKSSCTSSRVKFEKLLSKFRISGNTQEFERVEGLKLENWVR